MKRDMELVRTLLFKLEEEGPDLDTGSFAVTGYTREEVAYHFELMHEAGLFTGISITSLGDVGERWIGARLTWQGHEFLDAARNDTVWRKALGTAQSTVGTISLDLLKALLIQTAKDMLGLP